MSKMKVVDHLPENYLDQIKKQIDFAIGLNEKYVKVKETDEYVFIEIKIEKHKINYTITPLQWTLIQSLK